MNSTNISIGDYVIYSTRGICRVDAIESNKFDRETKDYFVFVPVFDSKSKYYIPVDFDSERVHIKPALTKIKADELLDYSEKTQPAQWIVNPNERKQTYDKIYKSGSREDIIKIIKAIKQHEKEQKEIGKQLYATDERLLRNCVNLITGELAYIFGKTPDEIREQMGY
ncbi:MAG: CarD family transcriptional regulator [Eubacterium sp.]